MIKQYLTNGKFFQSIIKEYLTLFYKYKNKTKLKITNLYSY